MKYLQAFLATESPFPGPAPTERTDKTDKTPTSPLVSVLSVPGERPPGRRAPAPPSLAVDVRPPCGDCGRTDWVVSVVTDYGARYCSRCVAGGQP